MIRDTNIPRRRLQSCEPVPVCCAANMQSLLIRSSPFICPRACFTWGRPPHRRQATLEATPMAMTMNGKVQLAAPRDGVDQTQRSRGAEAAFPAAGAGENRGQRFRAVAKMKVGPVSARFRASHFKPSRSAQWLQDLSEGEGGVAGFPRGATVGLTEQDGGTCSNTMSRRRSAQAGPARAAAEQRLGQETGRLSFFANFAKAVQG